MLTDKEIKALKPIGKDVFKLDGAGLYIRVSIHGTKTFVYRKKQNGKNSYQTLGEYPRISLLDARRKAGELQGVRLGERLTSQVVEAYTGSLDYVRPEQVVRRLSKDVTPEIGKKPIDRVTTEDLTNLLQKIIDRGSPVAANRTLNDLKHLFDFAYQKGWITSDPSHRITRKVIGGKEKSRATVLSEDQLKRLIKHLREGKWELKTKVAIAVLLLTGQRASEVLGIERKEIEGNWWTISAHRTKTGKEQKVYLSRPTRALLRLVDYSLGQEHWTLSQAVRRWGNGHNIHDLRRTMATVMSDKLQVSPHCVEKCLAHSMTGVMAVYNRALYLDERKAAWKLWARYLLKLRRTD